MSVRTLVKIDEIRQLIYSVRNTQVMLDKDLAVFYGVKPIRLREQVKRNLKRFPPDFMFQLTEKEVEFMVSQNAIPSKQHLGGSLRGKPGRWYEVLFASSFLILSNVNGRRSDAPMNRDLNIVFLICARLDTSRILTN